MAEWRWVDGYGPEALWSLCDVGSKDGRVRTPKSVVFEGTLYDIGQTAARGLLVEGARYTSETYWDAKQVKEALGRPPLAADAAELLAELGAEYCCARGVVFQSRFLRELLGFMRNALGVSQASVHVPTPDGIESTPLVFAAVQPGTGARCFACVMAYRAHPEDVEARPLDELLVAEVSEFEEARREFYAAVGEVAR